MNPDYTHISVVLDRSGSMISIANDTIGGFNRFLADQKAAPGKATFSMLQFDNQFETLYSGAPLPEVQPLTSATFQPRGSTALLDAVGREIAATGAFLSAKPENERPAHVVFVIITDGEENASHEFTQRQIAEMIRVQRETYSWQFVFIGANQDAWATAAAMNIPTQNSIKFAANAAGAAASYASVSANTRSLRSGGKLDMSFEPEDYTAQAKAGVQQGTAKP